MRYKRDHYWALYQVIVRSWTELKSRRAVGTNLWRERGHLWIFCWAARSFPPIDRCRLFVDCILLNYFFSNSCDLIRSAVKRKQKKNKQGTASEYNFRCISVSNINRLIGVTYRTVRANANCDLSMDTNVHGTKNAEHNYPTCVYPTGLQNASKLLWDIIISIFLFITLPRAVNKYPITASWRQVCWWPSPPHTRWRGRRWGRRRWPPGALSWPPWGRTSWWCCRCSRCWQPRGWSARRRSIQTQTGPGKR